MLDKTKASGRVIEREEGVWEAIYDRKRFYKEEDVKRYIDEKENEINQCLM